MRLFRRNAPVQSCSEPPPSRVADHKAFHACLLDHARLERIGLIPLGHRSDHHPPDQPLADLLAEPERVEAESCQPCGFASAFSSLTKLPTCTAKPDCMPRCISSSISRTIGSTPATVALICASARSAAARPG